MKVQGFVGERRHVFVRYSRVREGTNMSEFAPHSQYTLMVYIQKKSSFAILELFVRKEKLNEQFLLFVHMSKM